jgi:hypothetical protein
VLAGFARCVVVASFEQRVTVVAAGEATHGRAQLLVRKRLGQVLLHSTSRPLRDARSHESRIRPAQATFEEELALDEAFLFDFGRVWVIEENAARLIATLFVTTGRAVARSSRSSREKRSSVTSKPPTSSQRGGQRSGVSKAGATGLEPALDTPSRFAAAAPSRADRRCRVWNGAPFPEPS